jgi:xanthine dehydrogenase YagR molybdenum-binding subunit
MPLVTGLPLDRRDSRIKVTGRAKYTAEFAIDGAVHAVVVQSTIPSGEITGFDLSEAHAVPGVLAMLTPDNAPRLKPAAEGSKPDRAGRDPGSAPAGRHRLSQRAARHGRCRRHADSDDVGRAFRSKSAGRSD